jgi:hypothetical protein
MNGLIQFQVIRDGEATVMYGLDNRGQIWRGRPLAQGSGKYGIKWTALEETREGTGE